MEDFSTLVSSSALPAFASDLGLRRDGPIPGRVNVPILDPEAQVTYYSVCRLEDRKFLAPLLSARL